MLDQPRLLFFGEGMDLLRVMPLVYRRNDFFIVIRLSTTLEPDDSAPNHQGGGIALCAGV
jgi:hypothetical protein